MPFKIGNMFLVTILIPDTDFNFATIFSPICLICLCEAEKRALGRLGEGFT